MSRATKSQIRILAATALMAIPALVSAQGYYDDDIYYNASKSKSTEKTVVRTTPARTTVTTTITSYPAADTYIVNSGSTRDVDEYNRHGRFLVSDTATVDTVVDSYSATRRIQRFHNADIVNTLTDDEYAAYVLTEPSVVNIYIDNDPWNYYTPYWGSRRWWNLSWGLYDPFWGPSWSWNYGWNWTLGPVWAWSPGWSWGWGPAWGWGGPSWGWGGPGWGPGWGGPGWGGPGGGGVAWRPVSPSGASRPHNVAVGNGRGTGNSVRPVTTASANRVTGASSTRPGNGGYGYGSTRPGSTTGRYNSSSNRVNGSTGGNSISTPARGRNAGTTGSGSSTSRRQSSGSYNSGSSSSSSHSSGGFSGGSGRGSGGFSGGSSGGSRGGGGFSGGGGGGRGRR